MIWLIRFLYVFVGFVFGLFISGLFAGSKIQRLESLLIMILNADTKRRKQKEKDLEKVISLIEQELNERTNSTRPATH